MAFHVFSWFSWFFVVPDCFFMVFNGSRLVFHGFSWFFLVCHGFRLVFMVFLQNVPAQTVSWPNDPA